MSNIINIEANIYSLEQDLICLEKGYLKELQLRLEYRLKLAREQLKAEAAE